MVQQALPVSESHRIEVTVPTPQVILMAINGTDREESQVRFQIRFRISMPIWQTTL